ncbi:MAG: anti-sigma factor family protein, partial [Ktedonobacteraceae bacterium]
MSAYRELRDGTFDSTDLDVHLEGCASCRQMLARDMFIGERLRALPTIEPPPEMRGSVMRALAQEHAQFLQKASPGSVPTPEFLKPYLREHAQVTRISNHLSALSTAETGPLPIIHAKRRRRPRSHMSQFAVMGVAAMFLMVLMMGGITSLLLLAHNNNNTEHITSIIPTSLEHTDIQKGSFATSTPYQHVASAVANRNNIYYTAYSDDTNSAWMLLQLDRATKKSTPLLE